MIVYLDRSQVRPGPRDELRARLRTLAAFVDVHQPQMAAYSISLDEHANGMAVLAVHPDSASLERHLEIGGPEFRTLAPSLDLRTIEVFGPVSDRAVTLLEQKSSALGGHATVTLHTRFAGFDRTAAQPDG
jgi:hypothetical protein